MTRFSFVLGLLLVVSALMAITASRAEDAPAAGCTLASASFLVQPDQGNVTIDCSGLSEAFGKQLAEIMTRILQNRLDPLSVMAKLEEVGRVPEAGVARTVEESQRQLIIQSLIGKPAEQIAIIAHPLVEDSAEFAKGIATSLMMVGWQIEGRQVRRAAPKSLEQVAGLAVVVRDRAVAPPKALQLKAALAAARISVSLISDPTLAPDATIVWVGRGLAFMPKEPAK